MRFFNLLLYYNAPLCTTLQQQQQQANLFFLVFVFYCVLCYYIIVICNILPERSGIHRRWFIYDAQTFGRLHLQIGSPLPFKVVCSDIALDFFARSSARRQSIVAPVDKNASTSVDSVSEAIHPQ